MVCVGIAIERTMIMNEASFVARSCRATRTHSTGHTRHLVDSFAEFPSRRFPPADLRTGLAGACARRDRIAAAATYLPHHTSSERYSCPSRLGARPHSTLLLGSANLFVEQLLVGKLRSPRLNILTYYIALFVSSRRRYLFVLCLQTALGYV